jgi:hypothetical protein
LLFHFSKDEFPFGNLMQQRSDCMCMKFFSAVAVYAEREGGRERNSKLKRKNN